MWESLKTKDPKEVLTMTPNEHGVDLASPEASGQALGHGMGDGDCGWGWGFWMGMGMGIVDGDMGIWGYG